jgi:ubiquinone/menaquinone biosynthesis C-methylase UbiE
MAHICSVEYAGALDSRIRRWIQNPRKILAPYVREGMTALDYGCGPGFFTLDMADLVGETGHVVAADIQQGMLDIVAAKLEKRALQKRVSLHLCGSGPLPLKVDFALLFFMVHEVPDKAALFREIAAQLTPDGRVLMVEPPLHVSGKVYAEELEIARACGLVPVSKASVTLGKGVLLARAERS